MPRRQKKSPQVLTGRIEAVDINSIIPHPRNPRKHEKPNIEGLKKSFNRFGQMQPLLVWQNKVIAGCGRLVAAKAVGFKKIGIIRKDDMTPEEAIAYAIADNELTDQSQFDYGILPELVKELSDKDFDLGALGFQDFEINELLSDMEVEPPEEDTPEEKINLEHKCPKCGYEWSGKGKADGDFE